MFETFLDTIAAVATPKGVGGIGIIRVSGPETEQLISKIFKSSSGRLSSDMKSHQLYHGHIVNPDTIEAVDEGLCVIMRSPNSFTGETIAEFHGHGGAIVLQLALEAFLAVGARLALPGEFSRRAFLNGKLDLTQAEAVSDVINAKTPFGVKIAQEQLEGRLSRSICLLRGEILNILADIEAYLDFPEEDIPVASREKILNGLQIIKEKISYLIKSAEHGRILRDGVRAVILGRPNVGKSSLWNKLLKEERAIVTPLPGTTRDPLREYVNCKGVLLHLVDTAGICATEDPVEKIGVSLAKEWQNKADLVLIVIDRSTPLQAEDRNLLEGISGKKVLVVLNKSDLKESLTQYDKELLAKFETIETSVLKNTGIDLLEDNICKISFDGGLLQEGEIVTNTRHKNALVKSYKAVCRGIETLNKGMPIEIIAIDLKEGVEALGLITGENITEELLDTIFSKFCIGK